MTDEIWKPVPGYEGHYEASPGGMIRSLLCKSGPRPRARPLKFIDNNPYPRVRLSKDAKQSYRTVHSVIAATFLGHVPDGLEVRHLDGDPLNNRVENLAYGTRAENAADRVRHGTAIVGERHHRAKLDAAQVVEMRRRMAAGGAVPDLAREYGMSTTVVYKIRSRQLWRHI